GVRRTAAHRSPRRAGLDRDPASVRDRLRRRAGPAAHRPRPAPSLPHAARPARPDRRHPGLLLPDAWLAQGHLGPAHHLDGAGAADLLPLWKEAFEGAGGGEVRAEAQGRRTNETALGRPGAVLVSGRPTWV